MQFITSVTQKGQVTLPLSIRKIFGVKKYDKVMIEPADDHIKIKPLEDILDLAGRFKTGSKKPLLKARSVFEKKYKRI